jgi:hypothetical protein
MPTDATTPIACNFMAIAPEVREPHSRNVEQIFASVLNIRELADGYAFRLPLENAMLYQTVDFITNERLCCPFFTFTLVVGEELQLQLTGSAEVKAFIKQELVDPLQNNGTLPDIAEWVAARTPTG